MGGRVQPGTLERLSAAVSSRRDDVLAAWRAAVTEAARARAREPALLDMGPALLGPLLEDPSRLKLPPTADPAQISEELALLRDALEPLPRAESRAAARAISELQRVAAERFALAHQQAMRAVQRVLGAPDARTLLDALLESAPALHSCALYVLREGTLRREAAAGLAHDLPDRPDGLVELAARVREAATASDASHEPLLAGSPAAAAGLRALTAVPLLEEGAVAGVLEAGSRTAYKLDELDEMLIGTAAARAGPLLLKEEARRRTAELESRLALQNDLARILSESASTEEAMRRVLAAACVHLGWDAGAAWVLDGDGALRCRETWAQDGFPPELLRELCAGPGSAELPERAVRSGEPLWRSDLAEARELPRFELFARGGLRTVFVVPMGVGGETLGALELFSRAVREPASREPIETLGRQVGQYLRRGRAQEETLESQALKAAILASALDAFVAMDAQGRILEWNAAAERTFGWKREEVVGLPLAETIIPHRLQAKHSEGLRKHVETGEAGPLIGHRVEMPAMHREGREFPIELAITRIERPGGALFTGALRDITDRKRAERAARRVTETFQALIEASPLPIVAHDAEGRVLIWNRAAEHVSGWKRAEVLGKPDPFLPPQAHVEAQGLAGNGGQVTSGLEVQGARKDGDRVDLSISVAPLRTGRGARPGTIAIAADITESKRAQREAAETTRFREHFVGIVGHDLRNPLTAIVTAAQLLLRHGGLSERQARTVSRIAASSERMARMIGDLLDFTRSRLGGGFPIQTRRMDLRELSQAVIEELELAYPERTIEFEARGDAWGNWDPDRIAQVVSNLVGNALQHSPESGTVRVDLGEEGDRVLLETSNAGPPIPREVLPHIFEPGRRGPPGRGRKESSGLGLGLYIVQQIVLAHGGDISVRSSAEEGTTFTVSLPRRSRALPELR
jgi:PAS domain S-box-containing protein